ncbi:MazG family protein [Microbacterium sp. Au-Mic1]|uniref:MazG family protein n=1 Tax=Microbacterium sp. Au-Mic1 TaxID=2906457 RepID=UPI001E2C5A96|nr:MazG family protein [Microbacterium sp. Au-Mic1]MCE4025663.1 MazG family protein [Microbacterium sp. Au-Mic1]
MSGTVDPGSTEDPLRAAAEVMRQVREKCVWSQAMTHRELVPYLVEESAELIDAVERGDRTELREELGDLLWQVLFHAAIAAQDPADPFDIDDVARTLTEKMTRRHPHVFGDAIARTPEEVLVHWNAAKAAEKRERRSVLDGIPPGMPALARAQKILGRAAKAKVVVSEDPSASGHEEEPPAIVGPTPAPPAEPAALTEAELGDQLLTLVVAARTHGWDAERALRERIRILEDEVRAAEGSESV